jgi:hypothetical protein
MRGGNYLMSWLRAAKGDATDGSFYGAAMLANWVSLKAKVIQLLTDSVRVE